MNQARYSKTDYLKSSPHFFRRIGIAALLLCILLFCGSILVSAPLLGPADPASPPNPSKSAWFLLWIQELVSHGTWLIFPVFTIAALFVVLPWLPIFRPAWRASWCPDGQAVVNILTISVVVIIITLTMIAAFFRGPMWQLVSPF